MTYPISDVTRRVVYSGSAGTGPYTFTFEVLTQGDIGVYKNSTLLTLTTDYTVTINADGTGSITLTSAATSSDTIAIFGNKGIQRSTDFVTGGDLFANSLNDELDAQTIFAQQNAEAIVRAIRAPQFDPTGLDMTLPEEGTRATKALGFNASGEPVVTNSSVAQIDNVVSDFNNLILTGAGGNAAAVVYNPAGSGAVATTVQAKLREFVSVKDFGAVGDGVADDTAAIQAAIAAGGSEEIIYFPNGTYKVTGTLEMPLKCSGNFTIDGDVKWSFKKEVLQEGQITVTGDVTIDGVWFSRFNHIECANILFQSSINFWGVYWNDFGMIRCGNFVIDVDQGASINQNNYHSVRAFGGIHIRGTATTGIREAHNNMFFSVDTTGANLTATDGSTGHHLLNDSVLNQTNTVLNWYAENTGARTVKGNWNIIADNVDSSSPAFAADRQNYRLGSRVQGRQSSYLPITQNSLAEGGDWSRLNGAGIPVSLSGVGLSNVSLASISANAADSPDFSIQGARSVGGATFKSININYKLTNVSRVHATAFVYQEGNPSDACEIIGSGGVTFQAGAARQVSLGNGWYLLRISGAGDTIDRAGGATTGTIRIYTTTTSALTASDFRIITSFFVTTESIAPLPSINLGQVTGFSTAAPTGGTWSAGDICWNTTPSAGGIPGWMCVSAGAPGTWKAMANLAV